MLLPIAIAAFLVILSAFWYLESKYLLTREYPTIYQLLSTLFSVVVFQFSSDKSHVSRLINNAKKTPNKIFLVFEGKSYTYQQIDQESNRMARYLRNVCDVKSGDRVSILMENRPEYLIAFFALAKCGAIASLINYNLREKALLHCLTITDSRHIIYQPSLHSALDQIYNELQQAKNFDFIAYAAPGENIKEDEMLGRVVDETVLKAHDPNSTEKSWRTCNANDSAAFIFTSGTTGLPKAAHVQHLKLVAAGEMFSRMGRLTSEDRVYVSLPLYHMNAVGLGVGIALARGGSVLLSRKFSVSKFFEECAAGEATAMMYIGEVCRYLLSRPVGPGDRDHKVRTAVGNGLRPEIWEEFKRRFGITNIGEFYGGTEGTVGLFNFNWDSVGVGSVGHLGPVLRLFYGPTIIEIDPITEEPVRDKNGYCVECPVNKPGELINRNNSWIPVSEFKGYYGNKAANQKKLLENVFKKGDSYFRTGDLIKRDECGFYYFVDRLGDTFRWKGENVSTAEVSTVVSSFPGIREATVYGTIVPHHDGRAGMAAVVLDENFDWDGFAEYLLSGKFPKYAVPVWIRVLEKLEVTGTFKHQKVALRNQGIEVTSYADTVYKLDFRAKKFVPFGEEDLEAINDGRVNV
ncbi:hypothetical protein BKA69DRAFT_151743 [Paraphysoderma sedebokerense]|nr:hypothetical protein BKA69DRAFT_151743 [Paraphysoderma sedebokerense]